MSMRTADTWAVSLLVTVALIGSISVLAGRCVPEPSPAAAPRFTVATYETRINGRRVTCTETHDHQTGARSRAC